jgi:cyclohexa-1,5-dienecarbonyl-CoA hydratase
MINMQLNPAGTWVSFALRHPKGNIVTADMIGELRTGLGIVGQNPHVKLVTLEGQGPDFSFGASVPEHAPDRIGDVLPLMHQLIVDLLEMPAATAAIVRGRCLGGGFELALACDFVCAATDAVFGLPEIALGVFPPAACALLPARIGAARATSAIVTGRAVSASEWRDAGLIEVLADPDALDAEVERWFTTYLAPRSAVAIRHAAAAARFALLTHVRATLPELERLYLNDLMRTEDAVEGVTAFIEKREPQWKDR